MHLSAEVRDDPESFCEEVTRLRLQLSDHSLSELVEKEVLERNEDENRVRGRVKLSTIPPDGVGLQPRFRSRWIDVAEAV